MKKMIGAYVSAETHRMLTLAAARQGISKAALITRLVSKELEKRNRRTQPTP